MTKKVNTLEALAGKKQVAIYFSAHWCPPCRSFTPKLAEEYKKIKAKGFEIVFASSDKDRDACKSYFSDDHGDWLTLPYDDRTLKDKLSTKYKVAGIPTLVILDSSANLVTTKGREFIGSGKPFPFQPPTVAAALGDTLLKKVDGKVTEVKTKDALKGKNLALYFSAHWCPPCRGFTPVLTKLYNTMKKTRDDFEFVFVSSDKDADAFKEYYADMPWLALPYENRAGKGDLSSIFDVRGIPSLVTMTSDYTVINKAARGRADADPEGKEFPWFPKAVNDVNAVTDGLNDEVCVITLLDGASAADAKTRKADLEAVAKTYYDAAKSKKAEPDYRFFYEDKSGHVSGQIRKLTGATGAKTIILDLGDSGSFYNCTAEGDVEGQLKAFREKKLKKQTVKQ